MDQLNKKIFIAIGQSTASALQKEGFSPHCVAQIETSQGLFAEMIQKFDVNLKHILFPRSALPNPYLAENLTQHGAIVDEFPVYCNTKPTKRSLPKIKTIRDIIFTSPSTVKNFLEDYQDIPSSWKIWSKGPVTSKQLEQYGYVSEVIKHE